MIVHSYRQILFGLILSDYILVEKFLDFRRFGCLFFAGLWLGSRACVGIACPCTACGSFLFVIGGNAEHLRSCFDTVNADEGVSQRRSDELCALGFTAATETAMVNLLFCHLRYLFLAFSRTRSIMPYSRASADVIQ